MTRISVLVLPRLLIRDMMADRLASEKTSLIREALRFSLVAPPFLGRLVGDLCPPVWGERVGASRTPILGPTRPPPDGLWVLLLLRTLTGGLGLGPLPDAFLHDPVGGFRHVGA